MTGQPRLPAGYRGQQCQTPRAQSRPTPAAESTVPAIWTSDVSLPCGPSRSGNDRACHQARRQYRRRQQVKSHSSATVNIAWQRRLIRQGHADPGRAGSGHRWRHGHRALPLIRRAVPVSKPRTLPAPLHLLSLLRLRLKHRPPPDGYAFTAPDRSPTSPVSRTVIPLDKAHQATVYSG